MVKIFSNKVPSQNFFAFALNNFKFTEKLQRQCEEFVYIPYLVAPIVNVLYNHGTSVKILK